MTGTGIANILLHKDIPKRYLVPILAVLIAVLIVTTGFALQGHKDERLSEFATSRYAGALAKAKVTQIVPSTGMFRLMGATFFVETEDGVKANFAGEEEAEALRLVIQPHGEVEVRVPPNLDTAKVSVKQIEDQITAIVGHAVDAAESARGAAETSDRNRASWER